jgi:hypothetical protein
MGFHVHLSEFPLIEGEGRKRFIVAFVKMFYLFEPMLFSMHPSSRSHSRYCQSLQSIFNFNEICYLSVDEIYDHLVYEEEGFTYGGIDVPSLNDDDSRSAKGQRYLSLNLTNCRGNGIQTVEIRLGQSMFDINYINKYIYLLQSLFEFSFAMEQSDVNNNLIYPNQTVNSILLYAQANEIIPSYCYQTTAQYNNTPDNYNLPISAANFGRPISGFFISEGNIETRSKIIYKSIFY